MKRQPKNARLQTDEKPEQIGAQPGSPAPTPEQIRKRAYEIFMSRGGAPGHEWDDWLLAEAEFKAESELRQKRPTVPPPDSAAEP